MSDAHASAASIYDRESHTSVGKGERETVPHASHSARRRWFMDGIALAAAGGVLIVAILAARAPLSELETNAFRTFNGLPDAWYPFIWPFMQYGTFLTIPALAGIALVLRRWRLAIALALGGGGVYLLAKIVKEIVARGRPGALLEGVSMREVFQPGSLGFPSGHAAVAAAVTVVVATYLARRWTVVAVVVAAIVAVGRMYVGAHLPLDLIGGFALGIVVGCASNLVLGVPREAPRRARGGEQQERAAHGPPQVTSGWPRTMPPMSS